MKIKRSVLERLTREAVIEHLKNLLEAPGAEVADAHQDKKEKEEKGGKGEKQKLQPSSKTATDKVAKKPENDPKGKGQGDPKKTVAPGSAPKDLPATEDPADDELDKDVAEPSDEEDIDAPKSKISDELEGKTIQSVTMEPKSKILPGAMEIVLSFKETADPLRVLVTKSGGVKFHFKGALHNQI